MKWMKKGVLVGEECGQRYPHSGNAVTDKLLHSQIEFRYPTIYNILESIPNLKDGFIQPDIWYDFGEKIDLEDCLKIIEISRERNL